MNPPIKRFLAFVGSVAAGLLGTLVLAAPAQAHHPIIDGRAYCQADGQYKVVWKVDNGDWYGRLMKIVAVRHTPTVDLQKITVGTWLDPNGSVTETVFVPGTTTTASLYVDAKWYKNKLPNAVEKAHDNRTGTVTMPGTCKPEDKPTATFADACDGTVNVHVVNPTTSTKTFRITGIAQPVDVTAAEKQKDVTVPAGTGKITVEVKRGDAWVLVNTHERWTRPDCPPPTLASNSTCTEFAIAVTNPEDNRPFSVKITYGTQSSQPEWTEVKSGETKNFTFNPGGTTEAKVEFTDDWPTQTVTYVKPASCDELPKTGADTTTLIASGTGLAVLGGLAFFFARRRMVNLRKLASS